MSTSKSKSNTRVTKSTIAALPSPAAQPNLPTPGATSQGVVAATPVPGDVTALASSAIASLSQVEGMLPIDDALTAKEEQAAKVTNRVPADAMQIASTILGASQAQFPQFDAEDASASLTYQRVMSPVSAAARDLADRIDKSILKRRARTAVQTLALYGTLQSVSRLPSSKATQAQVKKLGKLLRTYTKPRVQKVTQKEIQVAAKGMRKTKVAKAKAATAAVANQAAVEAANEAGLVTPPVAMTGDVPAPSAPPAPSAATPAEPEVTPKA